MNKVKLLLGTGVMAIAGPAMAADVVIGVPNWPSVNATAHIMKVAIEENLGYDVELQNGTNPIVFEAMDKGSMHVHPEVWLPNQQNLHDTYVEEKSTVMMNPNGVEAFQGMCIPQAMADEHGITSIDQLTDPSIAELFDTDDDGRGEIWIGVPGWASTVVEKIRAKSYGYDQTLDLQESDETLAYANLDNAIKAGEPWLGFCYAPHYVFAKHDLQILEEPPHDPDGWNVVQPTDDPDWLEKSSAGSAWDTAYLHVHYAAALADEYPTVASMMNNVKFDTDTVSQMTFALVVDGKDPVKFAEDWVAEHEDEVLSWFAN